MSKAKLLRSIPQQIVLADVEGGNDLPQKIQLIRTGTFHHADYGTFTITAADLKTMKKNFDERVRGIDLALDFAHNSHLEAAGWFKDVELSEDGESLWATIEWTQAGAQKVRGKEYRYVSSDFDPNYMDNETKKKFGPTLNGAALTNRPVIKKMDAVIELSEGKGAVMTEEEINAMKAELEQLKAANDAKEKELSEMKAKLAEHEASAQKAVEEAKLAEKKSKFDLMLSEGRVVEAQREPFMKDDMEGFTAAAKPLKLSEVGNAGGQGTGTAGATNSKDVEDEIQDEAQKVLSEKKARTMGEAISVVLSEKPELAKKYNDKWKELRADA